jgi:uncharacterized protein DUF4238
MNSHTTAKYVLKQWAFDGPTRGSKRLWRYEKDHSIELQEGLNSATAHKGHFVHPHFPTKEVELEHRLNVEVEQPVNKFLADLKYRVFDIDAGRRALLTRYITVQFHRSLHRKSLKHDHRDLKIDALKDVAANKSEVAAIADRYSITPEEALEGLNRTITRHSTDEQSQREYFEMVEQMIDYTDETLLAGEWERVFTEANDPFVIGDAPVVTWNRVNDIPVPGFGFGTPDVEVLFPIAPTACLHIAPRVQRTRRVKTPTVREINEAQAAFATQYCFSNIKSEELDAILQPKFGTCRMGVNGFNIVGFDFHRKMFEALVNAGS